MIDRDKIKWKYRTQKDIIRWFGGLLTFPHEGWDLEVHERDCDMVGHVVLFHGIKLNPFCYFLPFFNWGGQTQEGAQTFHLTSSVLDKMRKTHTLDTFYTWSNGHLVNLTYFNQILIEQVQ